MLEDTSSALPVLIIRAEGLIPAVSLPPRTAVVPRSSNGVTEPHHCSQNYTRMYSFDERFASGLLIYPCQDFPLHYSIFSPIIINMYSRVIKLPQYQPPPPSVSLLQKGLDMRITGGIIFTAHSSQLTAHSSQRELYLDNFLSTFYKHTYFFPVYTQKQTVKSIPRFQDSAIHLVSIPLLIMNYEFIINYKFRSALYRNSRQAVWFDSS